MHEPFSAQRIQYGTFDQNFDLKKNGLDLFGNKSYLVILWVFLNLFNVFFIETEKDIVFLRNQ